MTNPETSPRTVQSQAYQGALTILLAASPMSLSGRVISAARYKVGIKTRVEMINYSLRTLDTSSKDSHLAKVASTVTNKQATRERAETMMG